jgi:hypothetical protein
VRHLPKNHPGTSLAQNPPEIADGQVTRFACPQFTRQPAQKELFMVTALFGRKFDGFLLAEPWIF